MSGMTRFRIGDVAARTGVGVQTLRAWERRYGLLAPMRTEGGHRLYRERDIARVERVVQLVGQGWTVAAAAESARRGAGTGGDSIGAPAAARAPEAGLALDRARAAMLAGARSLDAEAIHAGLDSALANAPLADVIDRAVAPVLHEVGTWWKDDPGGVACEHVASQVVRGRMTALLRVHRPAVGPALLAMCPPGELHDVGLLMASVLLAERGWRVTCLGASTPGPAIAAAIERVRPVAAVAAAYTRPMAARMMAYREAAPPRVVLGGPGFRKADVALGGAGFALARTIREAADLLDPHARTRR